MSLLEITEVAERAGADFLVNVVLNRKKEVAGVFCGNFRKAFLKGCEFCRELTLDFFHSTHDLVITSGGGYPLDMTFYQTIKGIVTAGEIVKEGGSILVISGMKGGLGSKNLVALLEKFKGAEQFLEFYSKPENFVVDQWQIEELIKATQKAKVYLYSRNKISPIVQRLGIRIIPDLQNFLTPHFRKGLFTGLIPEGPFVLPQTVSQPQEKEQGCPYISIIP